MSGSEAQRMFSIAMPTDVDGHPEQDAEWCWVAVAGGPARRIRFHDYAEIYKLPGLYECLFYDELSCVSPSTVCRLLAQVLDRTRRHPSELRVLDLGAGSGMVGEQLRGLDVAYLVGIDILDEARHAAERDRPGLYDSYLVTDVREPDPTVHHALRTAELNCLTSVAALGFGDIPPSAFAIAFNYIALGGLVAFTLRDSFLGDADGTGYRLLVERMLTESIIRPLARHRYRHRYSTDGRPLHYVAVVAEKRADVPPSWIK